MSLVEVTGREEEEILSLLPPRSSSSVGAAAAGISSSVGERCRFESLSGRREGACEGKSFSSAVSSNRLIFCFLPPSYFLRALFCSGANDSRGVGERRGAWMDDAMATRRLLHGNPR